MDKFRKLVRRYRRMTRFRDGEYLQEYNNDCLRKLVSVAFLFVCVLGIDLLTVYALSDDGQQANVAAIRWLLGCIFIGGCISLAALNKSLPEQMRGWGRNLSLVIMVTFYLPTIYYELQISGGLYVYVISLMIFGSVINLRMRENFCIVMCSNAVVVYAWLMDGIRVAGNQIYVSPMRMMVFCTVFTLAMAMRRNYEYLTLINQRAQLLNASEMDALTGLLNRRGMEEKIRRGKVKGRVCVALFDIDDFKKYNDTYGHAAGDECLRLTSGFLQDVADRYGGIAVRYGGEEMLLIFGGIRYEKVKVILERMLAELYAMKNPAGRNAELRFLSMSCGLVSSKRAPGNNIDDFYALIAEADKNLYVAKRCGKNCVIG